MIKFFGKLIVLQVFDKEIHILVPNYVSKLNNQMNFRPLGMFRINFFLIFHKHLKYLLICLLCHSKSNQNVFFFKICLLKFWVTNKTNIIFRYLFLIDILIAFILWWRTMQRKGTMTKASSFGPIFGLRL